MVNVVKLFRWKSRLFKKGCSDAGTSAKMQRNDMFLAKLHTISRFSPKKFKYID